MNAVCYKCGEAKVHPLQLCTHCQASPKDVEEVVQSFMLSKSFLPEERLAELAGQIRAGRRVEMAPEVRTLVLAQIRPVLDAIPQPAAGPKQRLGPEQPARTVSTVQYPLVAGALTVVGVVIAVVVILQSPWFNYRQVAARDTVEAYSAFIDEYPGSAYAPQAAARRVELNDERQWQQVCDENTAEAYQSYLKYYPEGKYINQANERLADFDRMVWLAVANSRDIAEIKLFINDNPDSACLGEAWSRIEWLINDWDWVREQDSVERYQYFLKQNPDHPQAGAARARLAELKPKEEKVQAKPAGTRAKLPRLNAVAGSSGTGRAKLTIANTTGGDLTVVLSNKDTSRELAIPAGGAQTLELDTGLYTVAAQAAGPPAKSYHGELVFVSAVYELAF